MPSEFVVDIEIDVSIPDFLDASVPLKQIAEKCVTDAQRNIRLGIDADGMPFIPLANSTIRRKKSKGSSYPNRALYDKGIMYNAIHAYKLGKNLYGVGVIARGNPSRDLVGMIHQELGAGKTRVIRRFIGMSEQTLDWANARMERWINERDRAAAHKMIKLRY
jgi:hypothetical protein